MKQLWKPDGPPPDLEKELASIRDKVPAPVFWQFGKTQSGKTSLVRYLTGAADAEIGSGFRPCTRTSRMFPFPTATAPVLTFLDTRGVDEPGYDPADDLAAFDRQAHLIVVSSRLTDFTHGSVREALGTIRRANPTRPVVLALTCLHEAHPQQQHPQPYPFDPLAVPAGQPPALIGEAPDDVVRLVREQSAQFAGLVDRIVPIDLTKPEEGFTDTAYGGAVLKRVFLESLPAALRTTFARLDEISAALKDLHLRHAMPVILGYSSLAATAGAVPIPFVDLVMLPVIQARMVRDLARLYGNPEHGTRFLEAATSLGLGLLARQAIREIVKFIPFVGSAAGAALAGASTYALGRAFCEYHQRVHQGHVPTAGMMRKLYHDQLAAAERAWTGGK
ncbi:hypothetical protein FRUB_09872 [Fimbriiglobus ruber]|uniref:G domain-containing protein n=1 Tax=Fimbriiglobus ruber TaxID=1908690 RepID=A0A225D088_9BACT|nr:hypothetical protein FRUB_09872 [Fimbriiglobus ruber]